MCRAHPPLVLHYRLVCPVCKLVELYDFRLAQKDEEIEHLRGTVETYRRELGII